MKDRLDLACSVPDSKAREAWQSQVDALLVKALRQSPTLWPNGANAKFESLAKTRISDHGIAALVHENKGNLINWPCGVLDFVRREALGQAMWEARHKAVLSFLLAAMAEAAIQTVVLKGTALAYLVYANPASRKRGDTDLLVAAPDRNRVRSVLFASGFLPEEELSSLDSDRRLQEVWVHNAADGSQHFVDLHWQVANSPMLEEILPSSEITKNLQTLSLLTPHARAPDRVALMIHACVHMAAHKVSPYFVDGRQLVEGDRLIWLYDLHLLAKVFSDHDWNDLAGRCRQIGIGSVCCEGLMAARASFEITIPRAAQEALIDSGSKSQAADYLLSESPLRRAWLDIKAIEGVHARVSYLIARILPPSAFMRRKYPQLRRWPVTMLYARRTISLFFRR